MSAAAVEVSAILNELQRRGVNVTVEAGALVLKPRRALDSDLLARVREHKTEILAALATRPATCSPSCYEVEPGRWIHHPWDGCKTPLPESTEPIVPNRADCGCPSPVCRRCRLWGEHCHCLAKGTCWHCRGESAGETGQCVVCEGTGQLPGRVQ